MKILPFAKALKVAIGLGFAGAQTHAEVTKFLSTRDEAVAIAGETIALKALQVAQPDAKTVTVIQLDDDSAAPSDGNDPNAAMSAKSLKDELRDLKIAFYSKIDEVTKSAGKVEGRPNVMPEVTGGEPMEHVIYNDEIKDGKKKAFKNALAAERFASFVLKGSNVLRNHANKIGTDVADRVEKACNKSLAVNVQKDYTTGAGSLDVATGIEYGAGLIRLFDQFGVAGQLCNVINTDQQSYTRVRNLTETANVSYPAEGGTAVQADAVFTSENMRLRHAMATSAISLSALKFSRIDMAESIANDFARWFAYQEDSNVFYGDGTGTYGRMLGVGTQFTATGSAGLTFSTAYGSVVASGAGTLWGKFTLADFQTALGRVPQYVWRGGSIKWVTTRQFAEQVMKPLMRAAGGNNALDISSFNADSFLGVPIVIAETLSHTSVATNNTPSLIPCYLGDFGLGVDLLRNRDLQIDSDASVQFDKGNIVFRGMLFHDVSAIHAVGSTTKAGPVSMMYTV